MKRIIIISSVMAVIFLGLAAVTIWGEQWFTDEDPPLIQPQIIPIGETASGIWIPVEQTGIVAIEEQVLAEVDLPFSDFSAEYLALTRNNIPVPFYVDDRDEEQRTLYFYAEAITKTLDAPAVYLLESKAGVAMSLNHIQPTGVGANIGEQTHRWEDNVTFLSYADKGDVWLGELIFAPTQIAIDLDRIQPLPEHEANLRLRLWSNNQSQENPDHHIALTLNNQDLEDDYWDGITSVELTHTIPANVLRASENVLTIDVPGDTGAAGEALYIDWIELAYTGELVVIDEQLRFRTETENVLVQGADESALVFDVTDSAEPVAITNFASANVDDHANGITFAGDPLGGDYIVLHPNHAHRPELIVVPEWENALTDERGADYVAIIPSVGEFANTLQPLLDYREEKGLVTEMIDVAQIYAEFGYGRNTPDAIRDFILYAVEQWNPAPRFVLLVGDASYDLYGFDAEGVNRNLIPTYHTYTTFAGYVASDTWLAAQPDDLTPQVALGRFPVQNRVQLATLVQKTLAYEQTESASWLDRALLVADDEPRFDVASDDLATTLADNGYRNEKLYMSVKEDIHDAIVGAINNGVGIINYVGHGSIKVWGDERVFTDSDVDQLQHAGRYPIFTTFTCLNGYFNHPVEDALAEVLLWADQGGIVAAVAPSGRTATAQQTPIASVFYESLMSGEASTLGEALMLAKAAHAADPFLSEVIHTFNLLGDPALRLHVPTP